MRLTNLQFAVLNVDSNNRESELTPGDALLVARFPFTVKWRASLRYDPIAGDHKLHFSARIVDQSGSVVAQSEYNPIELQGRFVATTIELPAFRVHGAGRYTVQAEADGESLPSQSITITQRGIP